MEDVHQLYNNAIGLVFQWKRDVNKNQYESKYQLVFKDTGFYLNLKEILVFANHVNEASACHACSCCPKKAKCKSILVKTPSSKIDLAVNIEELNLIKDLIEGALFQINLANYLKRLSLN
jgi:hypothetical protein